MSNQWLPEDDARDIPSLAKKLSDLLNQLEEVVTEEHEERKDNPTVILQMQAVRSIKNTLAKTFPYPEDTNVEEKSAGYPLGSTLPDEEGNVKFSAESVLPPESEDTTVDEVEESEET